MSIYLKCIYFLIIMLIVLSGMFFCILLSNKIKNKKIISDNFRQKKSSLYIKYNLKNHDILIQNYAYLNLDVSRIIVNNSRNDEFVDKVKYIIKNDDEKFEYSEIYNEFKYNLIFSYRDKVDGYVILRCDYSVEKLVNAIDLYKIDDLRKIHDDGNHKSEVIYYLNVKDFSSLNQRYGQQSGDYVLETIKKRLSKIDKKDLYSAHLNADQFIIYYNKNINKKKSIKLIKYIEKKLTKSIDIGYINIELVFGIGVCVGKYKDFDEFLKCAYIASDCATKRRHYNIVIYSEGMKLEENIIADCEAELENILVNKNINISYNPVFYHSKSKFIGYISELKFENKELTFNKIKNVAVQRDKINKLMNIVIDEQIINYIKKRTGKNSKLFINLKLEDLSTFLEVYLSNQSYGDCKIVICLDIRRGYEMINKISNISSNISKIVAEGIEFALLINYSNMYEYDYILKNATYLILDNSVIENINSILFKNKTINIIELAKRYDLELFGIDIKEYIQFESLLKYNTKYFSGPYFGNGGKKLDEIEKSKTRIFAKFLKDSKKNKNN